MKHFLVTFEPDGKSILIHAGATILDAAGQAGIVLNSVCGGKGTCGKCVVIIEPKGEKVLACQYHIQSDLKIIIPDQSRFFEQQILTRGVDRDIKVHPAICKRYIKTATEDAAELEAKLNRINSNELYQFSDAACMQLKTPGEKGQFDNGVTVVCRINPDSEQEVSGKYEYTVICLEPGDTSSKMYGVAVDIGTTTVVAKLIDLNNGKCIATAAAMNPQIKFGDDVISRISYAQTEDKLTELQKVIIDCLSILIKQLCKQGGISNVNIYEVVAVGNTTMNHIFLGLPIKQLGQAPYKAYSVDAHDEQPEVLGIKINPRGNIHTVENIAGFVGADTTAVAYAVSIDNAEKMTLVVDIGTNGEVLLGTKERIYASSCAAGPALEGARITCGSRAADGAIEAVIINAGDIDIDVIGNLPPRSICGSGLIDAMAVLLDLGVVDSTGRFVDKKQLEGKCDKRILQRLFEYKAEPAFCLAYDEKSAKPKVFLTQRDIRQIQLAKAAIRTGIKLLQQKFSLKDDDIEQVLLAGAFGNYIRRESAVRTGLLPAVPLEKIHFVGNAAGSGAAMILISRTARIAVRRLARKIEYIEIAHEKGFQDVYADAMMF